MKVWTNSTVSSENTSSDCTNTPSSLEDPTSDSMVWMSLMTCVSWLTHSTGSVWRTSSSSSTAPTPKISMLMTKKAGAHL